MVDSSRTLGAGIVAVSLLLAAYFLLDWPGSEQLTGTGSETNEEQGRASIEVELDDQRTELTDTQAEQADSEKLQPLEVVDRLTGESLDAAQFQLLDRETQEWLDLSEVEFGDEAELMVRMKHVDEKVAPSFVFNSTLLQSLESRRIEIPFYARIEGVVTSELGAVVKSVEVSAATIPAAELARVRENNDALVDAPGVDLELMLFSDEWSFPRARTLSDLDGRYSLLVPGHGLALVQTHSVEHGGMAVSAPIEQAQILPLDLGLPGKVMMYGEYLDTSGAPVPNTEIQVVALIQSAEMDFTKSDNSLGFAVARMTKDGSIHAKLAKRQVHTDANGLFKLEVPGANVYVVFDQNCSGGGPRLDTQAAYYSSNEPDGHRGSIWMPLVQEKLDSLRRVTAKDVTTGEPLSGASVKLYLMGDPWVGAKMANCNTDEYGEAWIPTRSAIGEHSVVLALEGYRPMEQSFDPNAQESVYLFTPMEE